MRFLQCALNVIRHNCSQENNMIKRPLFAILAIAAACVSAPAAAQSNFYVLGSLGRSTIDVDARAVNIYSASVGLVPVSTAPSDNDTAYKLQVGYRLTPMWSVEGGYTSLGTADYIHTSTTATVKGRKKADLFNIDLVGTVQINPVWSVHGRLGAYRWETNSDMPALGGGLVGVRDNGYDLKLGAGLQYEINKNVAIRTEIERFNGIGDQSTTGDSKVNMFSIGAVLKF